MIPQFPIRHRVVSAITLASLITVAVVAGCMGFGTGLGHREPMVHLLVDPAADCPPATPPSTGKALVKAYEEGVVKHAESTFDQMKAAIKPRDLVDGLGFDPVSAKYFDRVQSRLRLTDAELALFRRNGFVIIDQNRRLTFAAIYHEIYNGDMPVLVTTDSVLHALHASYDKILDQLESSLFKPAIENTMRDAHEGLVRRAAAEPSLSTHWRDIDLYLTVARNLLAGAAESANHVPSPDPDEGGFPEAIVEWNGKLRVPSKFGQDDDAVNILRLVQSLTLQFPEQTPPTSIYGGQRYVDYSQFAPRGHYAENTSRRSYFRCMMWLGRADCGWNVLPSAHIPCLSFDSDRELRNAALMTGLLQDTGGLRRLAAIDSTLDYLVGPGDELGPATLAGILKAQAIVGFDDLNGQKFSALRQAIAESGAAGQAIRSQVVISNPHSPTQVAPPAVFQLFGQRFCADSYVLSKVVYDSILHGGEKQRRMMPTGLDVMAALGHDAAVPLLEPELRRWNYAANLTACRSALDTRPPAFWQESLYNGWLDAIRHLSDDLCSQHYAPRAMKTAAWQHKQLQTGLGSWSELRHDNVLYAKQSYTAGIICEYPSGYVEPYPAVYARLAQVTAESGRQIGMIDVAALLPPEQAALAIDAVGRYSVFFTMMSDTFRTLETLANKELAAQPFTPEEQVFLQRTVAMKGNQGRVCGEPPKYDGWYYQLFYGPIEDRTRWSPTVADVHTDPNTNEVLQVAVGDAMFCVIAVDNGPDRGVYVGPVYSYYEFRRPAGGRLTDDDWRAMIRKDETPQSPAWTTGFRAPARSVPRPNPR
jgi:hypothetical protein